MSLKLAVINIKGHGRHDGQYIGLYEHRDKCVYEDDVKISIVDQLELLPENHGMRSVSDYRDLKGVEVEIVDVNQAIQIGN